MGKTYGLIVFPACSFVGTISALSNYGNAYPGSRSVNISVSSGKAMRVQLILSSRVSAKLTAQRVSIFLDYFSLFLDLERAERLVDMT